MPGVLGLAFRSSCLYFILTILSIPVCLHCVVFDSFLESNSIWFFLFVSLYVLILHSSRLLPLLPRHPSIFDLVFGQPSS